MLLRSLPKQFIKQGQEQLKMRVIQPSRFAISALATFIFFSSFIAACSPAGSKPFEETFETAGNWGTGHSAQVDGQIVNEEYELYVKSNHGQYIASAGEKFGNGIYEVEATQIGGPLNNGYGMVFHLDDASEAFYALEVSGDGYIWIGYCEALCEEDAIALVGGDWFPSPVVNPGLYATNRLKVIVESPLMTFYVNGVEIGRTSDSRLSEGDIAVLVEALGEGDVRVAFDNFKFTPK